MPPVWADARLSGSCQSVVWWLSGIRKWLQEAANTPCRLAILLDLDAWLQGNISTVSLQITFVQEHAADMFALLQPIQVSVAVGQETLGVGYVGALHRVLYPPRPLAMEHCESTMGSGHRCCSAP